LAGTGVAVAAGGEVGAGAAAVGAADAGVPGGLDGADGALACWHAARMDASALAALMETSARITRRRLIGDDVVSTFI
jgi:hypothetical protein